MIFSGVPTRIIIRPSDCRVQRYLVQGMLDAIQEAGLAPGFQVRVDTTIPTGAPTCHFTLWKATDEEGQAWKKYTEQLEEKALRIAAGKNR